MDFPQAEREVREMVQAGAERLGLVGEPAVEDFACKTWIGAQDPTRTERRITILAPVENEVDLTPVRDLWVERFGLRVVSESADAIFLERDERTAAVQRSGPGPDGERNAWVEASTGCYPAEQVVDAAPGDGR